MSGPDAVGTNPPVIACTAMTKSYCQGPEELRVLDEVTLSVSASDSLAIVGTSGSGKTTLLHLLAGLDVVSEGQVYWSGQSIAGLLPEALGVRRNKHIGFVYQFHHLMPEFAAWENVAMPLMLRGDPVRASRQAALELLARVGLADRARHKPSELSGGERQRVAIARALVTQPACVLADEPTGNLDVSTSLAIQDLLLELNETLGVALLLVTHDPAFAARCRRQGRLSRGRFAQDDVERSQSFCIFPVLSPKAANLQKNLIGML